MFERGADHWSLQRPVSNERGYRVFGFVLPHAFDRKRHKPVTASLVAVRHQGRFLVGYNRSRRRWELPAGGIEWGETPLQCAVRELREESCQALKDLHFYGLVQAQRSSGYHKYTAVYFADVEVLQPFKPNYEWSRIDTWDLHFDTPLDPVDRVVLEFCDARAALASPSSDAPPAG